MPYSGKAVGTAPWTSGRLKVTGNNTLYQLLADSSAKEWGSEKIAKEDRQ